MQLPGYNRGVGKRAADKKAALNLNLTVTSAGIIVSGSNGKLAPGCQTTASGRVITVPRSGKSYNWKALSDCVSLVKREFPDEDQVIVSADPLIEYQHIVAAMDSVRSYEDKELFPNVLLSAGVR